MRRERVTADVERQILMSCIADTAYLQEIRGSLHPKYFKSSYSKTIIRWVLEYFDEYDVAPGKQIQQIYADQKDDIEGEDDVRLISTLLSSLSEEWVQSNPVYSVKKAIVYLKQRNLQLLAEKVLQEVELGNVTEAEELVQTFDSPELKKIKGIHTLHDTQAIASAFNDETYELMRIPGVLGSVIGPICRGDFIGVQAFAKRGKSFFLNYIKEHAVYSGLKTLTFNFEISEHQYIRREWMSYTGMPKNEMVATMPKFVPTTENGKKWKIDYYTEKRTGFPKDKDAIQLVQKKFGKYFQGDHILVTLPSKTVTVRDIERYLREYAKEGFVPDLVIIDYADLMKSEEHTEYRHQLDDIWSALRRIPNVWNCALATVSQSNRAAATEDTRSDLIGEDIRKVAHVTRLLGINQNKQDKENQIFRVQLLDEREGNSLFHEVLVLSCLDFGRFVVDSQFLSDVIYEKPAPQKKGKSFR